VNVLALCAGIGGLELGIKLACPRSTTVCYVEGEAFSATTLISQMEGDVLDEAPIWSNVKTFDGSKWCGKVDCISGGYPCQPFSVAGKREGEGDPRHLWPDFKRIIGEVRPRIVFFENVPGHLTLGFSSVLRDLRGLGYSVEAGLFSAAEVGAQHLRKRLFIMGYTEHAGFHASTKRRGNEEVNGRASERPSQAKQSSGTDNPSMVADPDSERIAGCNESQISINQKGSKGFPLELNGACHPIWPPRPNETEAWNFAINRFSDLRPAIPESQLRGMVNGNALRVDQLRALGNAVVPLVGAYAWFVLSSRIGIRISAKGGI